MMEQWMAGNRLCVVVVHVLAVLLLCGPGTLRHVLGDTPPPPLNPSGIPVFVQQTRDSRHTTTVYADAWDPFWDVRDKASGASQTFESVNLVDFNGDGLLDYVQCHDGYSRQPGVSFWANRGTATKPSFERVAWLDDALPVAGLHACHLSFMDADGDGALDIFRATMGLRPVGWADYSIQFFSNRGNATHPQFDLDATTPTATEAIVRAFLDSLLYIPGDFFATDWDNDGDLDLLVTEYADEYPTGNATLRWYENGGSASVPQFDSDAAVFVLHLATDVLTSRMLDLDGDGLLDLVVSTQYDSVWMFLHDPPRYTEGGGLPHVNFTDPTTHFTQLQDDRNPFALLDLANSLLYLSFGDLDGDGDLDMVLGHKRDRNYPLRWYRNTGVLGKPAFAYHGTCGELCSDPVSHPRLAKAAKAAAPGASSDTDTVWVLDGSGQYRMYTRTGSTYTRDRANNPLRHVEIDSNLRYQIKDITGDGQEELIGLRHGFEPAVVIFHDTAPPGDTAQVRLLAEFPTSPPAAVDSDTTIYVVDVDGDGLLDIVANTGYVGTNQGTVTAPLFGTFTPHAGLLALFQAYEAATASAMQGVFLDVDSDGDLDFVHAVGRSTYETYINDGAFQFAYQASGNPWAAASKSVAGSTIRGLSVRQRGSSDIFDIVEISEQGRNIYMATWDRSSGVFSAFTYVGATHWSCDGQHHSTPHLNDFDDDGDADVAIMCRASDDWIDGYYSNNIMHAINEGASGMHMLPDTDPGPFGYTAGDYQSSLSAGDIDSDGDIDFIQCVAYRGCFIMWQQDGAVNITTYEASSLPSDFGFYSLPSPVLFDLNSDGLLDIVFGASRVSANTARVFINLGSATVPNWDTNAIYFPEPITGFERAQPIVGDFDGDSRPDVIMLDAYGVATGFTLDGTSDCCPEYRVHTPLGVAATGLGGMYNGGGVAIDIDGDSDLDLLVGGVDDEGRGVIKVATNFARECNADCTNRGVCVTSQGMLSVGNYGTCVCRTGTDGKHCNECAPGYYGPECTKECGPNADWACSNKGVCDDGWWGNGTCTCSAGSFGDNCQHGGCPPGEGHDYVEDVCTPCEVGRFSDIASPEPCEKCPPGTFANATGLAECYDAPRGHYQGQQGNDTYVACPLGTYSPLPGAENCLSCPLGRFADSPGQHNCTQCPPGRHIACTGSDHCVDCETGRYSDRSGLAECLPCGEGTHSATRGAKECTLCEPGRFGNAQFLEDCFPCATGHFSDTPGGTMCERCNPGTASDETGAPNCPSCTPGFVADTSGREECTACVDGFYMPAHNGTACLQCDDKHRSAQPRGAAACVPCALGEVQPEGTRQCHECGVGRYSVQAGEHVTKACHTCPDGAFCAGGAYLVPLQGYWRPSSESLSFIKCKRELSCGGVDPSLVELDLVNPDDVIAEIKAQQSRDSGGAAMSRSTSGRRLVREAGSFSTQYQQECAFGYTGPLCANCIAGFGRSGAANCSECSRYNLLLVVLGCVFGGAVVAFMVYRQLAANRLIAKKLHTYHHRQRAAFITGSVFNEEFPAKPPPHAAMVKVLASNLQVLAMAVSFDLRWPSFIESMFRAEDAGSAVSTQLVNIMCELEDEPTFPAAMKQVLMFLLLPIAFILVAACWWFMLDPCCCARRRARRKAARIANAAQANASATIHPLAGAAAGAAGAGAGAPAVAVSPEVAAANALKLNASSGLWESARGFDSDLDSDYDSDGAAELVNKYRQTVGEETADALVPSRMDRGGPRLSGKYAAASPLPASGVAVARENGTMQHAGAVSPPQYVQSPASTVGSSINGGGAVGLPIAGLATPGTSTAAAAAAALPTVVDGGVGGGDGDSNPPGNAALRTPRQEAPLQSLVEMQERLTGMRQVRKRSALALRLDKFIVSCIVVVFLLQATVVKLSFSVFACQRLEGEWRLSADLDFECNTSSHIVLMLVLGAPSLLLFGLGVPLGTGLLLYSKRHTLKKTKTRGRFGFLYFGYEPDYYFWEAVVMLRKVLILTVATFVSQVDTQLQTLLAILVLLIALFLQIHYQPFDDDNLDVLETLGLVTAVLTLYLGLFLFSTVLADGARVFITLCIVTINVLYIVLGIVMLFMAVRTSLVKKLGKTPRGRRILRTLCLATTAREAEEEQLRESKRELEEQADAKKAAATSPTAHAATAAAAAAATQQTPVGAADVAAVPSPPPATFAVPKLAAAEPLVDDRPMSHREPHALMLPPLEPASG